VNLSHLRDWVGRGQERTDLVAAPPIG